MPELQLLSQIEFFRSLGKADLERLAKVSVELHLPADHQVFTEGSESAAFYVIRKGAVTIYRDKVGEPMRLLARLGPGDYFGEFGLFEDARHTSSARTGEATHLVKINNSDLLAFLEDHPDIAIRLQMAAAKRHTINAAAALELGGRSDLRIRVDQEVPLTLEDGSTHVVLLDNLSPGGLSLRDAPEDWRVGKAVRFDLGYGAHRLTCEMRVAWIQGENVGLAFTDRPVNHGERIRATLGYFLRRARFAEGKGG